MNKKRCTFLMSSCDNYEDLWNPFFQCLDKFWPDCPYPICLSTEHKTFHSERPLHFERKKGNLAWSTRFMDALQQIDTEYVFLVLDDYFACDQVEDRYFEEVMDIMDKDSSIASFQFNGTRLRNVSGANVAGGG